MTNNEPKLFQLINKTPLQQVYEESAQGALANKLNRRLDIDTTHDFVFWEAKDSVINDWSAFNALHNRVLNNRLKYSSFLGDKSFDYEHMSPADIAYYEDFLGGLLKKVGHAIGSAATTVAHGARAVGLGVAHVARNVAVDAVHHARDQAVDVVHHARDQVVDTAHVFRSAGLDVAHVARDAGVAVAPYWKIIAAVAVMVVLCYTGVGIPAAMAIGSAVLGGLDAVKPADTTPYLPPQAGDGGVGGGDGESIGDDDGGEGSPDQDPNQSQTIAQQQAQAQAQAEQDAQAAAVAKAAHIKKIILITAGVITTAVIIWWISRKK